MFYRYCPQNHFCFAAEEREACILIIVNDDCIFPIVKPIHDVLRTKALNHELCLSVPLTPVLVKVYQLYLYFEGIESADGPGDLTYLYS